MESARTKSAPAEDTGAGAEPVAPKRSNGDDRVAEKQNRSGALKEFIRQHPVAAAAVAVGAGCRNVIAGRSEIPGAAFCSATRKSSAESATESTLANAGIRPPHSRIRYGRYEVHRASSGRQERPV